LGGQTESSPIGVRDNFFSLGGHSILAAQIFKEIAEQFSRQLPLSMLLQTPTIEGIARVLQERDRDNSLSILVPIQPQGTKPPPLFDSWDWRQHSELL
jgi:hypothetical protein